MRREVHVVVHGGDLFYRSRVPTALVQMAMAPLVRVAGQGIPVLIVPGNHERSRIPQHLWAVHPNIYIFDRPRKHVFDLGGLKAAFAGFPFSGQVCEEFTCLVGESGGLRAQADVRLLCMHQIVEGARVGSVDHTFRSGSDVVRGSDIPKGFAAILAGHIHRSQILLHDLRGRELNAPVIYSGSIERTSFAERKEQKHYAIVEVAGSDQPGGDLVDVTMVPLPARPMFSLIVDAQGMKKDQMGTKLRQRLSELDPDSLVRIQVRGEIPEECLEVFSAASLRRLAPPSMNVSLAVPRQLRPHKR